MSNSVIKRGLQILREPLDGDPVRLIPTKKGYTEPGWQRAKQNAGKAVNWFATAPFRALGMPIASATGLAYAAAKSDKVLVKATAPVGFAFGLVGGAVSGALFGALDALKGTYFTLSSVGHAAYEGLSAMFSSIKTESDAAANGAKALMVSPVVKE